jgi:hypothetical protein
MQASVQFAVVLLGEVLCLDHSVVKGLAAQKSVSSGGLRLAEALFARQQGLTERAASQVEPGVMVLLVAGRVEAVSDRYCCGPVARRACVKDMGASVVWQRVWMFARLGAPLGRQCKCLGRASFANR